MNHGTVKWFNNEKGWFEAHKQEYLDLVAAPLRELGDEVTQAFWELFPKWGLNLHVSRIYRDARRLHGRGPYKDHMWFVLRRPGESWTVRPAFYFEVAPESYAMGMGCYDAPPAMMARLRARIDQDPKPLEKLARRLNRQDRFRLEGVYLCVEDIGEEREILTGEEIPGLEPPAGAVKGAE